MRSGPRSVPATARSSRSASRSSRRLDGAPQVVPPGLRQPLARGVAGPPDRRRDAGQLHGAGGRQGGAGPLVAEVQPLQRVGAQLAGSSGPAASRCAATPDRTGRPLDRRGRPSGTPAASARASPRSSTSASASRRSERRGVVARQCAPQRGRGAPDVGGEPVGGRPPGRHPVRQLAAQLGDARPGAAGDGEQRRRGQPLAVEQARAGRSGTPSRRRRRAGPPG